MTPPTAFLRTHQAIIALILLALLVVTVPVLGAGSTNRLRIIAINEDRFYNYDFGSKSVSPSNVDWPIDMLFFGNATETKVKNLIGNRYDQVGSNQHLQVLEGNGNGWIWNSDTGQKTTKCPGFPPNPEYSYHIRFYSDDGASLYNVSWGNYVLASTHIDVQECTLFPSYGFTEDAEDYFDAYWRSKNWNMTSDLMFFDNIEAFRVQTINNSVAIDPHIWKNNGYASTYSVG